MAKIRFARRSDAEDIASIYAPYVINTAISFETDPPSPDEMVSRMSSTLKTHPWLVYEDASRVIGYAYAGPHAQREAYRWSAHVSVYVGEGAHRRGIGRSLYHDLLGLLRQQGLRSIFAGIALPNESSVALHEAMGFEAAGVYRQAGFKLGAWWDVGWWRLGLTDSNEPPKEPIPFANVSAQPEFDSK